MLHSFLQLFGAIIVFVLVLFATYYVTKWMAKSGVITPKSKNIKVIETFKIAPNKYIQIIQLGNKYYSIGVTKDNISFLSELDESQLDLSLDDMDATMSFKDAFKKSMASLKNKDNK